MDCIYFSVSAAFISSSLHLYLFHCIYICFSAFISVSAGDISLHHRKLYFCHLYLSISISIYIYIYIFFTFLLHVPSGFFLSLIMDVCLVFRCLQLSLQWQRKHSWMKLNCLLAPSRWSQEQRGRQGWTSRRRGIKDWFPLLSCLAWNGPPTMRW